MDAICENCGDKSPHLQTVIDLQAQRIDELEYVVKILTWNLEEALRE